MLYMQLFLHGVMTSGCCESPHRFSVVWGVENPNEVALVGLEWPFLCLIGSSYSVRCSNPASLGASR